MKELKEDVKKELKEIKLLNRKLFDPSLRISQAILETKEGKKFLKVSGPTRIFVGIIVGTKKIGKKKLKIC
jgi:flagellum-specific peptidoglycan hydrolase FlgJ